MVDWDRYLNIVVENCNWKSASESLHKIDLAKMLAKTNSCDAAGAFLWKPLSNPTVSKVSKHKNASRFSVNDPIVMLHTRDIFCTHPLNSFAVCFYSSGWISNSYRDTTISEYRPFVLKIGALEDDISENSFSFSSIIRMVVVTPVCQLSINLAVWLLRIVNLRFPMSNSNFVPFAVNAHG